MKPSQPRFRPLSSKPGYEVSHTGRVRRISTKREYAQHVDPNGRLLTTIRDKDAPFCLSVARAVGEAWCDDYAPEKRPVHIDGDKTNCRARNLMWVSVSEFQKTYRCKRLKSASDKP